MIRKASSNADTTFYVCVMISYRLRIETIQYDNIIIAFAKHLKSAKTFIKFQFIQLLLFI